MSDIKIYINDPKKVKLIKQLLRLSGLEEEAPNKFVKAKSVVAKKVTDKTVQAKTKTLKPVKVKVEKSPIKRNSKNK